MTRSARRPAPRRAWAPAPAILLLALASCGEPPTPDAADPDAAPHAAPAPASVAEAQAEFWNNLQALCGRAFRGEVTELSAIDTGFSGELVVHFRQCAPTEMRIPLHVGADRSRTWVLSRTPDGLRLKHDHRHEDGTEEELTWYGGDADEPGSPRRQAFPADDFTAEMLPEAATNVWTIEVIPGELFAYELERLGTERRVRFEFDLGAPVDPPPAPWGHEEPGSRGG